VKSARILSPPYTPLVRRVAHRPIDSYKCLIRGAVTAVGNSNAHEAFQPLNDNEALAQ